MKSIRIIWGLVLVLIAGVVLAQGVPQLINYQGRLTDDTGLPIDGTREMRFRMLDADTISASVLWSETQSSVQVDQGIYHVLLGSVNPVPPSALSQADIYLEVIVAGEILRPRSQVTSVAFAHKAASVPDSSITSAMIADGTITGSDIDSQTITSSNIADGTITSTQIQDFSIAGSDLLNDSLGVDQIQDIFVLNTGDTITGKLQCTADLQVDGYVGIGTTSPDYKLHVESPVGTDGRVAYFNNTGFDGDGYAVYGESVPMDNWGIGGRFKGGFHGVDGMVYPTGSSLYFGVYGYVNGGSGSNRGVYGFASGSGTNYGVYGVAAGAGTNYAGYFSGNVNVTGTMSKGGGSFRIDHPLEPENKYLYHSFVESPDMKNVYDGNAVLDSNGEAWVELPDWFEALNRNFRYQLTAIGEPGPDLYIAEKIKGNRFKIAGGSPGLEVSWQVTGIRQDAFANSNRIPVEVEKSEEEKGKYIHPEAFGKAEELGIDYKHRIEHMERGMKSSD